MSTAASVTMLPGDAFTLTFWWVCDRTEAWAALQGHWQAHGRDFDLRDAFARDPGRFAALSFTAPEVFADLSKNLVDAATLHFLLDLANECGLEAQRDAMLAGACINTTEGRAVLHTALRAPPDEGPFSADVHGVLHPAADERAGRARDQLEQIGLVLAGDRPQRRALAQH